MRRLLLFTALAAAVPARAQTPTTEQVTRALTRPDVQTQVRQRIASSGLTAAQIRARLTAAGYPAELLDPYLEGASNPPGTPDVRVFEAVRALGLAGEAETADLAAMAAVANATPPVDTIRSEPSEIFGLDVFRRTSTQFQPVLSGPVDPSYRLGPGDLLVLVLTGEVELAHSLEVNRDGYIVIPQVGQLYVAGLTLEGLSTVLQTRLARVYSGVRRGEGGRSRFEVSVARLRTNQIFVVGDVQRPGSYLIPGSGTVLTALYAAGGPTINGSLRHVAVRRGGRTVDSLDVYDYLLRGDTGHDIRLESGDVVFVPVRGIHVRISGQIVRPRTYELRSRETLRDLLATAGGFEASALRRVQIDRILPPAERRPGGRDRVVLDLAPEQFADGVGPAFPLQSADEVTVFGISARRRAFVTVNGNVWTEGRVGFTPGMQLSDALRLAGGPKPDVYLGQVLISRLNADSTRSQLRATLRDSTGTPATDLALQEEDEIRIFSRVTFRPERYVAITGAVRSPGRLPWREGMTLRDAVLLAQGLTEDASLREVEVARLPADRTAGALATTLRAPLDSTYVFDRDSTGKYLGPPGQPAPARGAGEVLLQPYDNVLVFRQPDWELHRVVTITGQVRYPGRYALLHRNEKLTEVLARAGGLTPAAYAAGVRFYRPIESPRPVPPSGLPGARSRLGVDLPEALSDSSFRDNLIMAAGDSVDIPEYNPVVRVMGAVGAPTGVSWIPGRNVDDYVRAAGGYSRLADTKRAYVEQPNGQMQSVSRKFLLPDGVPKPDPGAVVYVPEKDPNDRKDWAGIVGAVASVLGSIVTIIVVVATSN